MNVSSNVLNLALNMYKPCKVTSDWPFNRAAKGSGYWGVSFGFCNNNFLAATKTTTTAAAATV